MLKQILSVILSLLVATSVAFAAASYPTSVKSFPTRVTGDVISATFFNDPQDEITAIEQGLLNGFAHALRPDATANNRDIGLTTAQFRDLFLSGKVTLGATAAAAGIIRLPTTAQILWRNAANTADFGITGQGTDSNIEFVANAISGEADGTRDLGTSTKRWGTAFLSSNLRIGTTTALTGAVRLAAAGEVNARNDANTADVRLLGQTGNRVLIAPSGQDIQWGVALVALGGGAAPTFGTIGGSGPATAAQNSWMRIVDSTGVVFWVPVWK